MGVDNIAVIAAGIVMSLVATFLSYRVRDRVRRKQRLLTEDEKTLNPKLTRAIDSALTRKALARHRRRSYVVVLIGVGCWLVEILLVGLMGIFRLSLDFPGVIPGLAIVFLIGCGIVLLGVSRWLNSFRYSWTLRRHPWRSYDGLLREVHKGVNGPNGVPTLLLTADDTQEQFVLTAVTVVWRWRVLQEFDGETIWMAGDPRKSGVVSPPGGTYLLWVRHPRLKPWRRHLRKRAMAAPQ